MPFFFPFCSLGGRGSCARAPAGSVSTGNQPSQEYSVFPGCSPLQEPQRPQPSPRQGCWVCECLCREQRSTRERKAGEQRPTAPEPRFLQHLSDTDGNAGLLLRVKPWQQGHLRNLPACDCSQPPFPRGRPMRAGGNKGNLTENFLYSSWAWNFCSVLQKLELKPYRHSKVFTKGFLCTFQQCCYVT